MTLSTDACKNLVDALQKLNLASTAVSIALLSNAALAPSPVVEGATRELRQLTRIKEQAKFSTFTGCAEDEIAASGKAASGNESQGLGMWLPLSKSRNVGMILPHHGSYLRYLPNHDWQGLLMVPRSCKARGASIDCLGSDSTASWVGIRVALRSISSFNVIWGPEKTAVLTRQYRLDRSINRR